ncbi:MAG: TetR/AcrR family transcriptional regulator [Candidatus Methanomethylophilaceae archaeon]|nr:TetR/AcrR family transcriptional regulator [Candidatus Methanomethylophilaceae archaeon]
MSDRKLSKSEAKRIEARSQIMRAALRLFYVKGYDDTTTRDIVREAGILNGSLYNRFKSKDSILFNIVSDAMTAILDSSEKAFVTEKDLTKSLALPVAVELYIAYSSPNLAGLIYHASQSWEAVDSMVDMYRGWLRSVWPDLFHGHLDGQSFRLVLLAVIGGLGNVCGEYAHGYRGDYRDVLEGFLKSLALMVNMPQFEARKVAAELAEYVEGSDIRVCGYRISELDRLSAERRGRGRPRP